MTKVRFKPEFVKSRNARNFESMMNSLLIDDEDGRFGLIHGEAGRGKSRTCKWYIANAPSENVYLYMHKIWSTNETMFLRELALAMGITNPAKRKGTCYREIIDNLVADPRPVFIDEVEKLPRNFLEILRDLTNITTAPVILIGEDDLVPYLKRDRRVWTRVFQRVEFGPSNVSEIIYYTDRSTGLKLCEGAADIIYRATDERSSYGNFRVIKRSVLSLVDIANSYSTTDVTVEMARIAVQTGLTKTKNTNGRS